MSKLKLSEEEKQRRKEWRKKMAETRRLKKGKTEEQEEKQKEVISSIDKKICNRCGCEYKEVETVIREQQKCCPNCLAPAEWKS